MTELRFSAERLEVIGIDDFTQSRDFGPERGTSPILTDQQKGEIERLHLKLQYKIGSMKIRKLNIQEEELVNFDVKSQPRVVLHEGKVLKRSTSSIVPHHDKRVLILLNDVMLVTSAPLSTGIVNFSADKLNLHQVILLNEVSIADLKNLDPEEDSLAFKIFTPDKNYIFVTETIEEKFVWIQEIQQQIYSIVKEEKDRKSPGWQHRIMRHTFHSAALYNEVEVLQRHIKARVESSTSLDASDESRMTALHWASLFGKFEAVQLLVEAGCYMDSLNNGLNSAIMLAASGGFDEIVFFLIDQGADLLTRNMKDMDALFMAILYGHESRGLSHMINAMYLKGVPINKICTSGSAPLHECASRNLSKPILYLVDAGAEVNIKHGRHGLTPLQLACSSPNPDPETIRAFLDKGAHPNFRDTTKNSAFDMVLRVHQDKFQPGAPTSHIQCLMNGTYELLSNSDPSVHTVIPPTTSHLTLQQLAELEKLEFSLIALPVLMEIVKKGGRYSPESVANLRPSFQESILTAKKLWMKQTEPEVDDYLRFMTNNEENLIFKTRNFWTSDSASNYCLLCLDPFTFSNRRHHCRYCGILCCDLCSCKRLRRPVKNGIQSSTASPGPDANSSELKRVCDGCFNKLMFEYYLWSLSVQRSRREQEQVAEKVLSERKKLDQDNAKTQLFGNQSNNNTSSSGDVGVVKNLTNLKDGIMNDTIKALEERGEKIQDVVESSQQMKEAASEFQHMTSALLKQTKQRAAMNHNW